MKRWIQSSLIIAAGFVSSGCFVTNPLGIQPPGSYSGLELKQALADRGFLNFWLGVVGYCEKFSNSKNCRDAAEDDGTLTEAALLSSYMTPYAVESVTILENTNFYTGQSAEKCLERVGTGIFLGVNVILTRNEVKDTSGAVTDEGIQSAVELAGPVAPYMAALNCKDTLEEPGPLVYLGRTDKLFGDDDESGDGGGGDGDGESE